jgi:hypothetical protein
VIIDAICQADRRDGDDPEPLADGDHRRVRATKAEIGILAYEPGHSPNVRIDELHQLEGVIRTHAHAVQKGSLGRWPECPIYEVARLGKNRRWNHKNIGRALKPVRASRVMLVPAVRKGVLPGDQHQAMALGLAPWLVADGVGAAG